MGGGDLILTGDGGNVRLKLRDESMVTVGGNSRFLVSEDSDVSDKSGSKVMLISGAVAMDLSRIKKLYTGKAESYKLYTPTAICGVRGTQFSVYSDRNGRSRARVSEGEIAVSGDVLGDDARVSSGKPVGKGKGFSSDKGGQVEPGAPTLPSEKDGAKALAGKQKPDAAYEAYFIALLHELGDRITAQKKRFDALADEAARLTREGEALVKAGKAGEVAPLAEAARLKGMEQFLVRKEIVHRTHQFRGYVALLENSGLNLPLSERIETIYLDVTKP